MAKEKRSREIKHNSYYSSLTKLWIPPFPAAILSEIATITAGKPAMHCKKKKTFFKDINQAMS